jgi:hypothetical protein
MDGFLPETDYLNAIVTIISLLLAYGQSINQLYTDTGDDDAGLNHTLRGYCSKGQNGPLVDEALEHWYETEVNQLKYRPGS